MAQKMFVLHILPILYYNFPRSTIKMIQNIWVIEEYHLRTSIYILLVCIYIIQLIYIETIYINNHK